MASDELRKALHDQIDHLDEKSLKAMYSMFQDYFCRNENIELTDGNNDLINERLADYEKNPKNVIIWDESSRLLRKYL